MRVVERVKGLGLRFDFIARQLRMLLKHGGCAPLYQLIGRTINLANAWVVRPGQFAGLVENQLGSGVAEYRCELGKLGSRNRLPVHLDGRPCLLPLPVALVQSDSADVS